MLPASPPRLRLQGRSGAPAPTAEYVLQPDTIRRFPGGIGRDVLHQLGRYLTGEINWQGGLAIRKSSDARLDAKMRRRIMCAYAWCGASAPFTREHNRLLQRCGRGSYFS